MPMSIRLFYDRWPQYNRRLMEAIGALTDEQLALRPSPEHWPVWALVGHVAGTRVYWLCTVLGEPGAEATPFTDPGGDGWEDDLDHPRTARELIGALETTYAVIDGVLERWTPDDLAVEFTRTRPSGTRSLSRQWVVWHLMEHDLHHGGEISLILGMHGVPALDL